MNTLDDRQYRLAMNRRDFIKALCASALAAGCLPVGMSKQLPSLEDLVGDAEEYIVRKVWPHDRGLSNATRENRSMAWANSMPVDPAKVPACLHGNFGAPQIGRMEAVSYMLDTPAYDMPPGTYSGVEFRYRKDQDPYFAFRTARIVVGKQSQDGTAGDPPG